MTERVERRLAAILAVDVAGYSRLMGADEAGTARAVREQREAARPIVAHHGGRIVKTMGDGVLLEFPSVVAAVECAIAVQRLMAERNAGTPEPRRIVYRMGIHLGDVLIEGEDILGDGVNIAARLEGIAEPDGICLSAMAYEAVRGKIEADFSDLGERDLKNIARPVRVYAIELSSPSRRKPEPIGIEDSSGRTVDPDFRRGREKEERTETKKEGPPRLSIVVLPFANVGDDPEQEYFVDGVTESLTTDLSRISGSFVIGRNTAFTYKGKAVDLKQIGRELNVRYVLEGSVQRGGNRMRVNVQLIDAETGSHLWAERFDKRLADLFDMQDEIVARLAGALNTQLVAAEARRAERSPLPDSMELYFQGKAHLNKGQTPEIVTEARHFFERALAHDAGNVEALVSMAYADALLGGPLYTADRAIRLATAEVALTRVLSMVPEHALAHLWMGLVQIFTNRAAQGMAECEHALALDRNLATAHGYIGVAKYCIGHGEDTEAHVLEALRLSPLDTNAYLWMYIAGTAKFYLGSDEEAFAWSRRSVETNRNYPMAHFLLAAVFAQLGRLEEASGATRAGLALDPGFSVRRFRVGVMSSNPTYLAQRERTYEGMRLAGVPEH